MKLNLYLFSHGETYYNKSRRFTGWKNSRLMPAGIEHSKIIAEKLREMTFEIAFKSSLSRSSDSLKF